MDFEVQQCIILLRESDVQCIPDPLLIQSELCHTTSLNDSSLYHIFLFGLFVLESGLERVILHGAIGYDDYGIDPCCLKRGGESECEISKSNRVRVLWFRTCAANAHTL